MYKSILVIICLTLSASALAKHKHTERWYQERSCDGKIEYRLSDKTRVDCLTATHAIEHDFAAKWAEAIGQALHYGSMTGRKCGIILIKESQKDDKYIIRAQNIIDFYGLPIDLWVVVSVESPNAEPVLHKSTTIKKQR